MSSTKCDITCFISSNAAIKVAVTGAAGQIGYALVFRIASGQLFGPDTAIHLQLLELEAALPALKGVVMELNDCASELVHWGHEDIVQLVLRNLNCFLLWSWLSSVLVSLQPWSGFFT